MYGAGALEKAQVQAGLHTEYVIDIANDFVEKFIAISLHYPFVYFLFFYFLADNKSRIRSGGRITYTPSRT